MLATLAIANYRSLRSLVIPMGRINLVTGANGSGKSSLYRALRLLAETAQGGLVAALSREGGLNSTLWAGPTALPSEWRRGEGPIHGGLRHEPIALRLGFAGDDFGYAVDLGIPIPDGSMFSFDPEIKTEAIWSGPFLRSASLLMDRRGALAKLRNGRQWTVAAQHLNRFESVFTQLADPVKAPEVMTLRESIRGWRFYDHFRSDATAPARWPQVGTRTPVLSHDGSDLAAAWQTIRDIGDDNALNEAVDDAFPNATVRVIRTGGRLLLTLEHPGLMRPLTAAELSDGTLRYLMWIAALHTPRPPPLMVINEPETSLHPDLLPSLGRLILKAALNSQMWIVSHSPRLISALEESPDCHTVRLEKTPSGTRIAGRGMLDEPAWYWPAR